MNQENKSTELRYAGFWIRTLAFIVDAVIMSVIASFLFGDAVVQAQGTSVSVNFSGWYNLFPILYTLVFWMWIEATPGKWICKLKVVRPDGSKMHWYQSIIRYFSYLISGFVFMIGFFAIGFSDKKRGWHDKIANTVVVKR